MLRECDRKQQLENSGPKGARNKSDKKKENSVETIQVKKPAGKKEKMPAHVDAMLCKTADEPFSKPGWIYEPKLDGIRAVAYIKDSEVTLVSRRGLILTERYPLIEKSLARNSDNLILDGEVTALDAQGRPSFQLLQRSSKSSALNKNTRLIFYVFDVMYANGRNLCDEPLSVRREILRSVLKQTDVVKIVTGLGEDGFKAYKACVEIDLEGIVAKRMDSVYRPGYRSSDWVKIKSFKSAEFLICGYSKGTGSRSDQFGSLILGYYDDNNEIQYAGSVGTGFNTNSMRELLKVMKPLARSSSPFGLKLARKKDVTWLAPNLVAEIKFSEWTADGMLRIPVFLRLREDIKPTDVRRR